MLAKNYKILLLIFFLNSTIILAQNTYTLSIKQAIDTSLIYNKNIKRYKERVLQRKYEQKSATANFLPVVDFSAGYTYMGEYMQINMEQMKPSIDDAIGFYGAYIAKELDLSDETQQDIHNRLVNGLKDVPAKNLDIPRQHFFNADFVALQPLFTGGKIVAGRKYADANYNLANADLKDVENKVTAETIERYLSVVLLKEVVKTREFVLKGIKKHEAEAQKALEVGVISKNDVLRAKVAVSNAEIDLEQDKNRLDLALMALKTSMGLPDSINIEPANNMDFKILPYNIDSLISLSKQSQPIFEQIHQKKIMVEQKHALERSEFLPQIAAFATYGFFKDQYPVIMPPYMIGVQMKFNIFHGLKDFNNLKSSHHLALEVQEAENYANSQISLWINKAYKEVIDNQVRYNKLEATVNLAKENLRVAQKRFHEGVGKSIDVLDAQMLLQGAMLKRLHTLYKYYLSINDLGLAVGNTYITANILSK